MKPSVCAKALLYAACIAAAAGILWFASLPAASVTASAHDRLPLRFDFGSGKTAPGYIQVLPGSLYREGTGFGFDAAASVTAVDRGGRDRLRSDFCTGIRPFFFTVDLQEGNYHVTVTLGDSADSSETVVKAESRRLMLEKVTTRTGAFATRTFTVNVRNSRLKSGEQVRLKADEQPKLDWDDRLTLEFSGACPCVCALEIIRADKAVTVYLAGDSTVTDQVKEPYNSWGQMLPCFFRAGVAIANHAESGEALKSFVGEKRLEKILDSIQEGDYLFIQFAHNDQKKGGAYAAPFTDYQTLLKSYIGAARKRGAIPVLVTSMHRRRFDDGGKVVNSLEEYPDAMRQVAREQNVALIDLHAMSRLFYEALGIEGSQKAFLHYPAHTFAEQPEELQDDSHFSSYGGYELAKCVVEGIRKNRLGIARYLQKGLPSFNPSRPDPVAGWTLPVSPPQPVFGNKEGNHK
jgi:lysophospholipase L1-like esterase